MVSDVLFNDVHPGVITKVVDLVAKNATKLIHKICVDGKKINMAGNANNGVIDLFGFEDSPTVSEQKKNTKKSQMFY